MSYLFGDSSPSDLRIDYIELLRDALDFSAQLLLADERMQKGATRVEEARRAGEAEVARLQALGGVVSRAVEGADVGAAESATAQCAHDLLLRASETVRAAGDRVQQQVNAEAARVDDEARRDRERCVEALEKFLKRHDLPNMTSELRLQQQGGTGYVARLYVRGLTDLAAVLDLDIPPTHALAHVARVEKLVERLEVHAPEAGGWLRKEVKLRPQRLDKEHVTALVAGLHETTVHLRSSPDGSGVGFDLVFREESPRVTLVRVGEATELPPFDLDDTDSAKARELRTSLLAATAELAKNRKALVETMLGKVPLKDHREPRVIVERLVAEMAPVVREIIKRSLTKTELVLKRQTGDGRREEIFVSRADLQNRLRPLGEASRALFKPLELGDLPPAEVVPGPPPPVAKSEMPSRATQANAAAARRSSLFDVSPEAAKDEPKNGPGNGPSKDAVTLNPAATSAVTAGAIPGATKPAATGAATANAANEIIAIDDSLDRLLITEAAPKSK